MTEPEGTAAATLNAASLEELARRIAAEIEAQRFDRVAAELRALHRADAVDVIELLDLDLRRRLLEGVEDPTAADYLEEMEDADAAQLAEALDPVQLAAILEEMELEEAADVLGDLPAERAEGALFAMSDAVEAEVRPLMAYPDDTAGGRMSRVFIAWPADLSVEEAIGRFRREGPDMEGVWYVYAVDAEGRLVGVVDLRGLLTAQPSTRLGDVARSQVFAVAVTDDQEQAAQLMARYDLLALPVVDEDGRLVGVLHHDDLVDVLVEEATEDMYRMVGVGGEEKPRTPVRQSVRLRLPWLVLNLCTQLVLIFALVSFEEAIAKVAALAVLFPLVTGQGGNVGAQTMTLMVRSMALGEVDRAGALRVVGKEVVIGLVLGACMGVLAGIIALLVGADTGQAAALAVAVVIAMALNLAAGGLAGAGMPLLLERLGVDPALGSSMLVTTITDTLGVILFMGLFVLLVGP